MVKNDGFNYAKLRKHDGLTKKMGNYWEFHYLKPKNGETWCFHQNWGSVVMNHHEKSWFFMRLLKLSSSATGRWALTGNQSVEANIQGVQSEVEKQTKKLETNLSRGFDSIGRHLREMVRLLEERAQNAAAPDAVGDAGTPLTPGTVSAPGTTGPAGTANPGGSTSPGPAPAPAVPPPPAEPVSLFMAVPDSQQDERWLYSEIA